MVFTDPPYNVAIAGNVSGLGKVKHREFAMASGEMNTHELTDFLETAFQYRLDGAGCRRDSGLRQARGNHSQRLRRECTTLFAAEKSGRRGYGIEIDCH
jgi:DNA modification methylase